MTNLDIFFSFNFSDQELFFTLYLSGFIAIFSVVWIYMLLSNGDLFDFIQAWSTKYIFPRSEKLHKVFTQCEKCFAGQLSFWLFIVSPVGWNFWLWILQVFMSIFLASFIGKIYKRV